MSGNQLPSEDEINAMGDEEFKVFENRVRRAADRHGLKLEKSRIRDPRAVSYNTYRLTDASTNTVVASRGQSGYGLPLTEVTQMLLTTPMESLAAELEERGYRVSLGKSHGGALCRIHEDSDEIAVGVDVVDFGRDPLGREVDIRWVSQGGWNSVNSPIDTDELADRIVETLPHGPIEWRKTTDAGVECYETYGGDNHYILTRKRQSDGEWTVTRFSLRDGVTEVKEESGRAADLAEAKNVVKQWEFERKIRIWG